MFSGTGKAAPPMIRALAGAVLWLCCAVAGAAPPASAVGLDFSIALDPATRNLRGEGTIDVPPGPAATIILGERFALLRIRSRGQALVRERAGAWRLPAAADARRVEVGWEGRLDPLDPSIDHRQTLSAIAPVAGPAGSFLPAATGWYPMVEGALATWRVTLELPAGQRGLVPGRLLEERDDARGYRARFEFAFPAEGIDLMAGPYIVSERTLALGDARSVRLRTWFAPGLEALADDYLAAAADYIRLYDGWIGAYPFTEFGIVSSPTPTGFGMPTLTYLGADVLRLPFIRASSLGHEVLHNWWGNGVYPDYARGNWSEGLTTFMADYHYRLRESEDAARDVRLGWLRDFAAVPPGQDAPLVAFTSRTHGTSQIVGYHKAAMLFVMLRDLIGTEAFDRGARALWSARRFDMASWDDLRRAFEKASARDLAWFFAQWTTRAGAPALRIRHAGSEPIAGGWRVRLTLAQGDPAYRLQVPVTIDTDRGAVAKTLELDASTRTVEFDVPGAPRSIVLDPGQRLFRRLGPDEAPPILRDVMVNPGTRAIVLTEDAAWTAAAQALLGKLLDEAPRIVPPDTAAEHAPLVVLGTAEAVDRYRARRHLGPRPAASTAGTAQAWTERADDATLLFIAARDAASLAALGRPLPHYGRQSWLAFEGSKAIERGVWAPQAARWSFE
jgi:hypothetical protein